MTIQPFTPVDDEQTIREKLNLILEKQDKLEARIKTLEDV